MSPIEQLERENEELRRQLSEAEETLAAIREGKVDAIVVEGQQGAQIFSLVGADRIYRVLVETMNEAALTVAPDGTILFSNQRFCELMRTAMPEAVGRRLSAFAAAEERHDLKSLLAAARTGNVHRQFVLLAADGTAVPVQLAATPLEGGERGSVCVVASDLTQLEASARAIQILEEHQRAMEEAQAALRESEAKYRIVADNPSDWEFWIDPGGRFVYCSPSSEELTGHTAAEFLADPGLRASLIHPEDRERFTQHVHEVEHRRLTGSNEWRYVHPDGTVRWFEHACRPVFTNAGDYLGCRGSNRDVTKRKEAEEALHREHDRMAALICSIQDEVWFADGTERFTLVNPTGSRTFGLEPDQTVNVRRLAASLEVLRPDGTPRPIEEAPSLLALRGEVITNQEEFVRTPATGELRYRQVSASPVRDASGEIIGSVAVARDITALKKAQDALRENEERLRLMIETSPVAIGFGDTRGRIFEANESFYQLTGYTREELEAGVLGWDRLTAPEYAELDRRMMAALAATGSAGPYEEEYIRKDGSRVPLLLTVSKLPGRDEHIAFLVDISTRKAAQEAERRASEELKVADATRAERERFLAVLEALPAMICLLEPDYHVAFANKSFRDRFGEAEGRHCYEYCYGRTQPCEFCETYTVLASGRPHNWEVHTPEGSVIEVHDFPFTDADGSTLILEMDLDVTERRRIEQDLRNAHADLEARASQLRALASELTLSEQRERRRLARVLHDHLQQLLVAAKFRTAIVGRLGDELTQQASAEIEHLLDESISAARLLTSELNPPILQEAGLPAGLEWLARWMADRHGLHVNLVVEEDLPPLAEDVRVLLFESVRELLFNAVKHARVSSVNVSARRIVDDELRIIVSDSGPGFDPAIVEKAGETGRGFGLFSIRERLALLGGRLDIESAPGSGSRFMLTAPMVRLAALAKAPAPAPPAEPREPVPPPTTPAPGARIRMLIVDDHAVVREGLRRLLSHEPDIAIAGEAADGQQAIEMAAALQPDVILMDLSMPRLNGIEATRAINRDYPNIRIIGLSMFDDPSRAQTMRMAGAVDFISKSGPPRDLVAAIYKAVQAQDR